MAESKIEWTDRSDWNPVRPVRGCTRVSNGCGGPGDNGGCYAEALAARFSKPGMWGHGFAEMKNGKPRWTGKVELQEDRLTLPLKWKKPAKIFASSTSDIFHEKLPDEAIDRIFAVIALCPQHTFQVLTKRPERMRAYIDMFVSGKRAILSAIESLAGHAAAMAFAQKHDAFARLRPPPLPNVWLGTTCEDQPTADERIPHLLATPAAVRFLSCEPLLGPLDLRLQEHDRLCDETGSSPICLKCLGGIDWIICGGESGPQARPMHPDWARSLRDQCAAAAVPFFFKQWGEWAPDDHFTHLPRNEGIHEWLAPDGVTVVDHSWRYGKKNNGRLLDGIEHNAFPEPRHD